MGRRSVKSTKSGKFMNPTDQARKEARKKELKKNKKQRQLVRTTVLKNKDPGTIIKELDKLDEVEFNTTETPALADKVLKEKRKKLKETLDRVMKLYQKDNPTYWNELKRIEADYERRRFHRIQYFEAVKQAEGISNVEEIPLPDIPMPGDGEIGDIPLPDGPGAIPYPAILRMPLPPMPMIPVPPQVAEVQSILKKAPMVVLAPGTLMHEGRDPPGVPCGAPPDLLEMDDMSDDEMEKSPEPPSLVDNKTKGVRFSDADNNKDDDASKSEMDRFMKEVEDEFSSINEDDLQPPGTEGSSKTPSSSSPQHNQPEETEHMDAVTSSSSNPIPIIRPDSAAVAASAIAAASSSRGITSQHQFYPPPPGHNLPPNIRFQPPLHTRPNFAASGPRTVGSYVPSGSAPLGARFNRPPSKQTPFSNAPQAGKSDKIVSDSMIQAKPQIRSLSADVTRFVPTIVKTKKEEPEKFKRPEYQIGQSRMHLKQAQPPKPAQQSKDDAYADFMKEMQGLL